MTQPVPSGVVSAITDEKFARLELDPALQQRRTTTDHIAAALRAAIYDGQFGDGEELNQVELASHFKVSRVPIREALRQLQAEGLVRNEAHRRTVVVGLSLDEITQLMEMRAVLEGHLVAKATPRIAKPALQRLRRLCDEMDGISDYDHEWVRRNWEFHRTLYAAAASPMIADTVEQLHLRVERYTRRAGGPERMRRAAAEHRRVLDLVSAGDAERAGAEIRQHILNAGEEIRRRFTAAA